MGIFGGWVWGFENFFISSMERERGKLSHSKIRVKKQTSYAYALPHN